MAWNKLYWLKMGDVFQDLQKVFGVLSFILLFSGTIGNLFSCYVCHRIKNNSTFTFLTFMTIADLLTLYYWNLNNFLSQFTRINLLLTNLWVCKIGNYVQFSSLQCSAWILVRDLLDLFEIKGANFFKFLLVSFI